MKTIDTRYIDISTQEFGEICEMAVRYALPRKTCSAFTVIRFLKPKLSILSAKTLAIIKRDIEEHKKNNNLGDPDIDAPQWITFLAEVTTELNNRDWCQKIVKYNTYKPSFKPVKLYTGKIPI